MMNVCIENVGKECEFKNCGWNKSGICCYDKVKDFEEIKKCIMKGLRDLDVGIEGGLIGDCDVYELKDNMNRMKFLIDEVF